MGTGFEGVSAFLEVGNSLTTVKATGGRAMELGIYGIRDIRNQGNMESWNYGFRESWIYGIRDIRNQGYTETGIYGIRELWSHGIMDLGNQGSRDV